MRCKQPAVGALPQPRSSSCLPSRRECKVRRPTAASVVVPWYVLECRGSSQQERERPLLLLSACPSSCYPNTRRVQNTPSLRHCQRFPLSVTPCRCRDPEITSRCRRRRVPASAWCVMSQKTGRLWRPSSTLGCDVCSPGTTALSARRLRRSLPNSPRSVRTAPTSSTKRERERR